MHPAAIAPMTMCLSKATLAAGTTSTVSTTGTTTYVIGGLFYTKTALSNVATPTTDWMTGNAFIPIPIPLTSTGLLGGIPAAVSGYACAFAVGFDTSGNLKAIQGPIVGLDANGSFISGAPSILPSYGPAGPNPGTIAGGVPADTNFCPIGIITVKLGATAVATWTFGSNNWAGVTGVTTSFIDVASLPGRPLANLTYS